MFFITPSTSSELFCFLNHTTVINNTEIIVAMEQLSTQLVFPVYTNTFLFHFHINIFFIETANYSLRFHLASTPKRSKTMIVFTENDNF